MESDLSISDEIIYASSSTPISSELCHCPSRPEPNDFLCASDGIRLASFASPCALLCKNLLGDTEWKAKWMGTCDSPRDVDAEMKERLSERSQIEYQEMKFKYKFREWITEDLRQLKRQEDRRQWQHMKKRDKTIEEKDEVAKEKTWELGGL